jgi:S1-C subfamily serine protease
VSVPVLHRALVATLLLGALVDAGRRPAPPAARGCPSSDTVANAEASVVMVLSSTGLRPQTATGFAIAPGLVVTVAHAVGSAGELRVVQGSATGAVIAHPVVVDTRRDLALLDVPALQVRALSTADAPGPPGACATILVERADHAAQLPGVIIRSVVVTIDVPAPATREALQLGAEIRRGDSGAPVLDASGRIEGIVFAASREGPPTGWAVSASELRDLLSSGR